MKASKRQATDLNALCGLVNRELMNAGHKQAFANEFLSAYHYLRTLDEGQEITATQIAKLIISDRTMVI